MDKSCPKILLLSATLPGSSGVGQLFLRDLVSTLPQDRIAFAVIARLIKDSDRAVFPDVAQLHISERSFNHRKPPWLPQPVSIVRRHLAYRRHTRTDAATMTRICEFAASQQIRKIWAVLDSPSIYRIAPLVAKQLGIPLVTTVWDPPEGVGLQHGLDPLSRRLSRRDFERAVRSSEICSAISERMGRDYEKQFGVRTVVLRHSIAAGHEHPGQPLDDSVFRLGFCGSLYASAEWKALLDGLDLLRWKIGHRPIHVTVAGSHVPYLSAQSPANLEFLGWRDMDEVVTRMSLCHACYFPYWFNPAYQESVRYCFATKITTYLTAGTPVLYHGPQDAAVMDFFRKYPVAATCHSLKPADVAAALEQMADPARYRAMKAEVGRAIEEELNLSVFHSRFRELLTGIKTPEELSPADRDARLQRSAV